MQQVTAFLRSAHPEYDLSHFPRHTPGRRRKDGVSFWSFRDVCPIHGYAHSSNNWWAMTDDDSSLVKAYGCHHDTDHAPRVVKRAQNGRPTTSEPYDKTHYVSTETEHPCRWRGDLPNREIFLDAIDKVLVVEGPHRVRLSDPHPDDDPPMARAWNLTTLDGCGVRISNHHLCLCPSVVFTTAMDET